jgi:hypothetical protein
VADTDIDGRARGKLSAQFGRHTTVMALAQPEQAGLVPERFAPLRGSLATTACMETLQVGYRHAVAATSGCSLSLPVRIAGAIVRIRRSAQGGPGAVRLLVLAGAEVPYIRMVLDEEAYRIAGHAHLVGLPIRVYGKLQSRGGFRRLTGADGVAPVKVDETERDRLMKALQENLDIFEEACTGDLDGAGRADRSAGGPVAGPSGGGREYRRFALASPGSVRFTRAVFRCRTP